MEKYSDVTPTMQLLNSTYDIDILNSSYKNIRWNVGVSQYITIDATYEANLPGLAFDYYGDQELWRAILHFNGLNDPLNDIVTGTVLAMPDRAGIDAFMSIANATLKTNFVL